MTPPLVLFAVGTRPEVIKLAPVVFACRDRYRARFRADVLAVAQHTSLLRAHLAEVHLVPVREVEIERDRPGLAWLHACLVDGIDRAFDDLAPDVVVVQGDTSTAHAAALVAFYRNIPVVHVEAGLRAPTTQSPFPEEAHRRIIMHLAARHVAPTARAATHLIREGTPYDDVVLTGNTGVDAELAAVSSAMPKEARRLLRLAKKRRIVVVTCHRREGWESYVPLVARACRRATDTHEDLIVFWPLHANPVLRANVLRATEDAQRILVTEPLGHRAFAHVLRQATLVITDSGGVIEEATTLGVRTLVIRNETERPEAIDAGFATLVPMNEMGTHCDALAETIGNAIRLPRRRSWHFGDGRAAPRIARAILELLPCA